MDKRTINELNSMSKFLLAVTVPLLSCSGLWSAEERIGVTRPANIPFKGSATGGTLILGHVASPHYVHIHSAYINTSAGESAEAVVKHLARAVVYSDAIFARSSISPNAEALVARFAQGSTLSLIGSNNNYLLAGTETGLGIPKPPLCLSCSYDKKPGTIEVKWINPPDDFGYDSILIRWRHRSIPPDTRLSGGGQVVNGKLTSYTIKIPAEVNDLDVDVWLSGFRHEMPVDEMRADTVPLLANALPSNAAAIHVTGNGYCQEETYGIPFTAGVAPSWSPWSTPVQVDTAGFEQGDKYAGVRRYQPVKALSTKPFYQVIKAPLNGVVHAVYRKFLGLTAGHTYRLTACLSTLDMDSIKGDWAFSLHAAPTPNGKDLSVEQLAGLVALPDGRRGPEVGRIAFYGPANTTRGDFALVFSGKDAPGGFESSHITLPPGVDTITVWVRFSCSDPNGKVGFSGVKLEDLTAIKNPKSPAEIIAEENAAEVELLQWIEKASRESLP